MTWWWCDDTGDRKSRKTKGEAYSRAGLSTNLYDSRLPAMIRRVYGGPADDSRNAMTKRQRWLFIAGGETINAAGFPIIIFWSVIVGDFMFPYVFVSLGSKGLLVRAGEGVGWKRGNGSGERRRRRLGRHARSDKARDIRWCISEANSHRLGCFQREMRGCREWSCKKQSHLIWEVCWQKFLSNECDTL